jgi:hypothetical protein
MKKTDFINVIRKIVRDEIKPLISEEITKQMAKLLSEVMRSNNPHHQLIEHTNNVGIAPTPKKTAKFKTGNPNLDDALNNTSGGIIPEGGSGNVSIMGELARIGESEKLDIHEFLKPKPREINIDNSSNLNMIKSIVSAGNADEVPSVMDVPDEINPIAGVLKQDFRERMKLIESKAKSVGGGNFLSSMVGQMPGPSAESKVGYNLKSGPINEAIE